MYMVFWPDSHCSSDQTDFRRNRNQYAGSLCSAWNDDPADYHRSYGSAIRSVPESYYEGSLALGATKERSIFFVMLPAAKSGILAAVVLGIGRAIGETMAVVMVAGNQPRMPQGILKGVRTMTANIVTEMGYATGLHREALIATAVVLFIFILIINLSLSLLNRRAEHAN